MLRRLGRLFSMALSRSLQAPDWKDIGLIIIAALGLGGIVGGAVAYLTEPFQGVLGGFLALALAAFALITRVGYDLLGEKERVEQASPRIVLTSSSAHLTNWIGYKDGAPLSRLYVAQAVFANQPFILSREAESSGVVAEVEYFDITGKNRVISGFLYGRWEHREHPASLKPLDTFDRLYDADFPANGVPRSLLLVIKNPSDESCYAVDNTMLRSPTPEAIADRRLPNGHYRIRVVLKGDRINRQYWLTLYNKGQNAGLELSHDP